MTLAGLLWPHLQPDCWLWTQMGTNVGHCGGWHWVPWTVALSI